ncbi:hypothetical protein, partial [Bacillus cereus group sp. BfR-BA-01318]|uniref:hypothetical protein n=1 Tax=Bacillus cereus group sp. BfR-BA-01318 TaxID=2920295 RepID=UPI0037BF11EE
MLWLGGSRNVPKGTRVYAVNCSVLLFTWNYPRKKGARPMSKFVICHMQKFKMRDVKGLQIHNQREKE